MQTLTVSTKHYTTKQIIRYMVLGAFLGISIFMVKKIPQVFHDKWLELGSAYDVEDEFFYSNVIRHAREYLYLSGVDFDNALAVTLRDWQKKQVDKAFTKIPETDGERIIWLLDLDVERWYKMHTRTNIPEIMPFQLKNFDELTSMPMKSRWARETERFERANRLAAFFFFDAQNSGLSEDELDKWRWKIVRRMDELVPELDKGSFLKLPTQESHLTPLQWSDTIFVGASEILLPEGTHIIRCNKEAISILLNSRDNLRKLLEFYQPIIIDSFGIGWMQRASGDANGKAESLIRKHCPNFIK